jgi:uncharacterized protein YggE
MKIFFIFLMLSSSAFANSDLEKTISVTGICKKNVLPDRVSVTVTIEELHKKQQVSSERANKKYNQLLKEMKSLKLKDSQFATVEYRVFPHRPWENRKQVFKGYKTRIALKVSTSEMDKAGKLLTIGNTIGQDFVSGPDTFASDSLYDQTYKDCLKIAMKDAYGKAKIIAQAGKRKLGKVLAVSEGRGRSTPAPRPMYKAARLEMASASAEPPQIEFGKDKIQVNLSVYYDLD